MTSFAELGLPRPIIHELSKLGITEAFPIQEAAIPDALAGKDVLGRGPTGSGKTFTFGLPILTRLSEAGASRPGRPRGLVLVPTRELAAQVRERLSDPAAALGLRVLDVVGGVNINRHIRALAAPVDLLVATPGRAQDLHDQGYLKFDQVLITALDEADQMADMGFLPQVRKLMRLTPAKGQRLLFSATLDGDVDKLVKEFMDNPTVHSTAPAEAAVDTMSHYRLHVGNRDTRAEVVARIAARTGKTIMFMRTKHGVDRQVKKLRRVGVNAAGLHGDKGQGARTSALAGFAEGSVPVLIATDIAARGIDISDVDLVVHIDPPAEHKAYLHRAGRTARAGATGTVITLVTDEQIKEVTALLKKAGVAAQTLTVHEESPELVTLTGARMPSGKVLGPFGAANASNKFAHTRPNRTPSRRRGEDQQSRRRKKDNTEDNQGRARSQGGGRRRQASSTKAKDTWGNSAPTRRRSR